jgi:hypothetical protein
VEVVLNLKDVMGDPTKIQIPKEVILIYALLKIDTSNFIICKLK